MIPEHVDEQDRLISTLAAASGATIARIRYRASSTHQFPTPVHDVLLGYDWVRENLLPHDCSRPTRPRIGVCGELVGGSLAVMLGLTECRLGETRIGAAAVNNPIVDWVFPDDLPEVPPGELPEPPAPEDTALPAHEDPMASEPPTEIVAAVQKPRKRASKPSPLRAWQLHGDNIVIPTVALSGLRDILFRKPDDFLDRFASPIHFFRSPHGMLLYPEKDDEFASRQPDEPIDIETQLDISHYQSYEASPVIPDIPTLVRCRAYARIYPPSGTNLNLPVWHVTTGLQSPLSGQTSELIKMLRRSIARQTLKSRTGRNRWHDASEKEQYEAYAEGRVQHDTVEGTGLWSQQDPGAGSNSHIETVGIWLKQMLRP